MDPGPPRRLAQVAGVGPEQVGVLAAALPEQVVEQRRRDLGQVGHLAERVARRRAHPLDVVGGSTSPERSARRISTLSALTSQAAGSATSSQPRRSQIFAIRKLFFRSGSA